MTPLKRPNPYTAAQLRAAELKESLTALSEKDQKFIYERIKDNQHLERLFVSFLKVIREYDFLPQKLLKSTFTRSTDYVYQQNYLEQETFKQEEN